MTLFQKNCFWVVLNLAFESANLSNSYANLYSSKTSIWKCKPVQFIYKSLSTNFLSMPRVSPRVFLIFVEENHKNPSGVLEVDVEETVLKGRVATEGELGIDYWSTHLFPSIMLVMLLADKVVSLESSFTSCFSPPTSFENWHESS